MRVCTCACVRVRTCMRARARGITHGYIITAECRAVLGQGARTTADKDIEKKKRQSSIRRPGQRPMYRFDSRESARSEMKHPPGIDVILVSLLFLSSSAVPATPNSNGFRRPSDVTELRLVSK